LERAKTVIVAIPPPAIKSLKLPLEEVDNAVMANIQFVPSVRINVGYRRHVHFDHPAITPCGPGRRPIVGISSMRGWMQANAPTDRDIVRISASAWRSEQLLGCATEHITRELLADCLALGVVLPAHDWLDVLEEPNAIVCTPPGHFCSTRSFVGRDRNGLFFAGDWLTGSTVEGAIRSGESAAGLVLTRLDLLKLR
jgi:predicted NAD/FAD-dependent oxidoreductase